MTGLELLKAPNTTAGEIADIISEHCPPMCPAECDRLACRECWFSWLTTGKPPKAAGPSDRQTAPDEEGLHPNLVEMYAKAQRKARHMLHAYAAHSSTVTPPPAPRQNDPARPLAP